MDNQEDNVFRDVQTIRNILFGDQHKALVSRIDTLEKQVKDLQQETAKQAENLRQKQQELDNWKKSNSSEYIKDQASISTKITDLATELHNRMDNEKIKHTELLDLLAGALQQYTTNDVNATED